MSRKLSERVIEIFNLINNGNNKRTTMYKDAKLCADKEDLSKALYDCVRRGFLEKDSDTYSLTAKGLASINSGLEECDEEEEVVYKPTERPDFKVFKGAETKPLHKETVVYPIYGNEGVTPVFDDVEVDDYFTNALDMFRTLTLAAANNFAAELRSQPKTSTIDVVACNEVLDFAERMSIAAGVELKALTQLRSLVNG